jgi:hypothetical protein
MATMAPRRSAWSLPARAAGSARVLAPIALGGIVAIAIFLRTRDFDVGYWIDEGLSVGIADRPLGDIPGVLRLDGSPPLYYSLLHFWIGLVGRSESATHALSLIFAVLAVPAAWWAVRGIFGARAGWMAALLVATNPFLTQYAQETRMYALVMLLGILACGMFLRALVPAGSGAAPARGRRRWWAVGFAFALTAMLYTHNWSLFFGAGCGVAWLGLLATAPRGARRDLLVDGLIAFGGALVLYAPWLPTLLFQARHTGAPWSSAPGWDDLFGVPGRLLGTVAQLGLLFAGGAGVVALLNRREGGVGPRGRAVVTLLVVWVLTVLAAWLTSQVSPAWASRYLSVGVAPVLLAAAAGLAHAGRLGLVGAVIVAIIWAGDGAPSQKSNVRDLAQVIAPSLRPGDLVVSTQPEQIPVLSYYLPAGLSYATLWGPVDDLGVTDWRDGVRRLRGTTPERDLKPLLDRLPRGRRVVLVEPFTIDIGSWLAPWTELVRVRSTQWRQYLANDPRLTATAIRPSQIPPGNKLLRATVLVKE